MGDDELTCNPKKLQTTTLPPTTIQSTTLAPPIKPASRIVTRSTTAEPEIIWSVPPTQSAKIKTKAPLMKAAMSNDGKKISLNKNS